VWELAGDEHDHNASDNSNDSATASCGTKDYDYNNTHGRRLLIAKTGHRLRLFSVAVCAVQKAALNSTDHKSLD